MKLFSKKQKISTEVMMHLIFETTKSESTNIFPLLDKVGIVYDETEVQLNVIAVNYELCRYALYKGNKKDIVDNVLKKVYDQFFYIMQVGPDKVKEYETIMFDVKKKLKDIFSVKKLLAPKEEFIYRLFLEQINVKEQIIDSYYVREFLLFAQRWLNNAEGINDAYLIYDTAEDLKKNEHIDFRF